MHAQEFLVSGLLLLTTTLSSLTTACDPASGDASPLTFGPSEYPPLETIGWNVNHFSLFPHDLAASKHFYIDILGMREIFTYAMVPGKFEVIYLGYPSGGRNGSGYQTPQEMFREKNNMQGLLEFVWIAPDATNPPREKPVASTEKSNTFSHLGLIVPDMTVARKRIIDAGVKVLVDVGSNGDEPLDHPIMNAYGFSLIPPLPKYADLRREAIKALVASGGNTYLIIEDPDGNMVEVQPRDEAAEHLERPPAGQDSTGRDRDEL